MLSWCQATTVVAKDSKIFEKPRSNEEAVESLRGLSGSAFQFVKFIAGRMLSAVETSHIKFRQLVDRELHDYVRRYPFLLYSGASRATASCASLTPLRHLQLYHRDARKPPGRLS
jgi:predicted house-cleaning NTP pyrophosphatase (Maf/HAM1 superfamily)